MAGLINWKKAAIPASNPDPDHVFAGIDIADDLFYLKDSAGNVEKFPSLSQVEAVVLATELTGIVFTDDTAIVATDTILEAMGKLQAQNNDTQNKLFKDFIRTTSGLVNNTNTLENFFQLSTTVPETGNYKISCSYSWSLNDGSADFIGELILDGSTQIYDHRQEPKDTGGTGITLPNTGGGNTNTGTDQRHPADFSDVINLTAGAHTIDLNFAGSAAGDAAAIYRAAIMIERWND